MRFGSGLAHVMRTSKHRRRCLVKTIIINYLALILSWHFSDLFFRVICLFLYYWIWCRCQISLKSHHIHWLGTLETSRTMTRKIINEIRLLLNILCEQLWIDLAYVNLGGSAKVISDRCDLLPSSAASLRFDPDNFGKWLNCLASNLVERNDFLFHTIGIVKTLLRSSWVAQNGLARCCQGLYITCLWFVLIVLVYSAGLLL